MDRMTTRMRSDLGVAQPFAAPATETELAVAEILAEFLKLDRIGCDDSFADLGLDSFTALQVSLAAEERHGLAINTDWLAGDGTLRTLCARAGASRS
jgi:mycobactin peptide synthetase MbtF